jgi:hypothetical protein
MTAPTIDARAVRGRRIELTYYRELPDGPKHPGIITRVDPAEYDNGVWIRLDGTRCNVHARHDYEGLTYLDEVMDVPELPVGRFTPAASSQFGFYEHAGVLLAAINEDGEDLIVLTGDRDKAYAAAVAYLDEIGVDPDYVRSDRLRPFWAVFEWQPEDSEMPWTVRWPADGEDHAVRIHYLAA